MSLVTLLKQPPTSQKVIYVYDPKGNCGKSLFIKHLLYNKKDFGGVMLVPFDSANQTRSAIACVGKSQKVFVFNVNRSLGASESFLFNDFFSIVESIKDGMLSTCYYGNI